MLELNRKRPIRVQSITATNHLCDGEVDWTDDNRREQDLMQRLTFSSSDDLDETTNSETATAETTTTIPTCCRKGRKDANNNNNNNDTFSKKDKISKISNSLNRKQREKRFEIRKSKHRFRLLSYLTMQKVLVRESSEKFKQIYSLLNMVSLILIIASISIGLSIGQQKVTAQSIQTNQRALKQQQLQSSQANIADALGDNSRQQQLQLLRSANVELNRERSQRLQRDTSPAPDQSQSSSSITNNNQLQQPTCGYPGSPAHASVTFNTSHVVAGTSATYNCDNGYELLGPPRRLCQANGTWSPVGIPFCGK